MISRSAILTIFLHTVFHLHLVHSTQEFKLSGVATPGFPILLWSDLTSCSEANTFLRHYLMRGQIGSRNSWLVIGATLYDYFSFLEAHELDWSQQASEDKNVIEGYRDYCFETANLKRNTVRLRIGYVCEFYKFAQREGWIDALPFRYEIRQSRRRAGFLAHTDASGGDVEVPSPMPRKHKSLVKFLTTAEIKLLLCSVARQPHHSMIIRLALQTGLRREELASFPLSYVINPDRLPTQNQNVRVRLDPQDGTGMTTKGNKERVIYMSTRLMRELHHYAVHHRSERDSQRDVAHRALFLNQLGDSWSAGGKGLERMVSSAGAKVGVQVHPHMLRHTYATHTLVALQRQRGDTRIEPLVFLQKQLGHASIQTTMEYLHLVNELADSAVLTYDAELNIGTPFDY
jgi:integrase/recombinase XerD